MAGGSAGERLIGWYGGVAEKNLSTRPDFVRNWLMLGFQAMRGKVHLVPYGDLLPSGNHGYQLFMDSVVGALADFDNAVVTSIFTPNEIFHALRARPVTAEAVASFASGAQAEGGFIAAAEGRGVPETYCSYHRILMGMATSGVLGKPRMLASCSVACDANNLTFKALGRFWGVPHVYVDVPYDVSRDSVLYVADELRELARATEDAFSRKLDESRLREVCACSERTMHELAATLPTRRGRYLANTMTIDMMEMLDLHLSLGLPECEALAREMQHDFLAASPYEGVNLVWAHVSPYFLESLGELVNTSQTSQIVASDMMFEHVSAGDAWFDASSPYEFMAERLVRSCFNGPATRRADCIEHLARETGADAVVLFCHWGCKQTAGAAQLIRRQLEGAGWPVLVLDGDACDRANCMEGQMSTRFSAFLEMVEKRKEAERHGS